MLVIIYSLCVCVCVHSIGCIRFSVWFSFIFFNRTINLNYLIIKLSFCMCLTYMHACTTHPGNSSLYVSSAQLHYSSMTIRRCITEGDEYLFYYFGYSVRAACVFESQFEIYGYFHFDFIFKFVLLVRFICLVCRSSHCCSSIVSIFHFAF